MYVIEIEAKEAEPLQTIGEKVKRIGQALIDNTATCGTTQYSIRYTKTPEERPEAAIIKQTEIVLECQSKYFAGRNQELLKKSKFEESKLKKMLQEYREGQTRLF